MGTYNSAVITNGGQSMIARAVAGASLEFTTIKTSSYAYPTGTNLATLTTINGIKQSKDITGAAVYNSRVIKISAAVDNTGISTAYTINTIGIYAKVGSSAESLFAVVTASAADTMPAYDNKPYSYIYEINLTMQNAANVTVTVNTAGLVNVADLNAAKVEIQGEIADLKSAINAYKKGIDANYDATPMGHGYRSWIPLIWESGNISNGADLDNPKYARTDDSYYLTASSVYVNLIGSKYSYRLIYYNSSHTYVTQSSWKNSSEKITVSYPYTRVLVKANDNSDVNPSDVEMSVFVADTSSTFPNIDDIAEYVKETDIKYTDVIANNLFPYIDIKDNVSAGDQFAIRVLYMGSNLNKAYVVGVLNGNNTTLINPIALNKTEYLTVLQEFDTIRVIFALTSATTDINGVAYYVNLSKPSTNKAATLADKSVNLSGKNLSILGVSFDTYAGYIPTGNPSYYSDSNLVSVYNTWWKKLISVTGATLLVNNSWSGACASTVNGLESSGVQRSIFLDDGTSNPDVIIIGSFIANDWVNSTIGSWEWSTALPGADVDLSNAANYAVYKNVIETYSGAMATIFTRLMQKYPKAKIYAMDLFNYNRSGEHNPTGNSATQNIMIYNDELRRLCNAFGVGLIEISKCGINAVNSADYTVETGTTHLHPNAVGHSLICDAVLKAFRSN